MSGEPPIVNHPVEYGARVLQARSAAPGAVRGKVAAEIKYINQCTRHNAAGQIDA
jgi:hypothetical protein